MTTLRSNRRIWPRAAGALLLSFAQAQAADPLPEPLTRDDALCLAGADHPALALSRARVAQLEADAERVAAHDAIDIGATLEARIVEPPSTADDQSHNDSRAAPFAHKRLDDFGHTAALEAAAATTVTGGQLRSGAELLRQRSTRALLAQLHDRPGQLPSSLVQPDLVANDRPLPEYVQLVEAMLKANPNLLSLRADLEAARLQVRAQRTGRCPVLRGSVAAAANERSVGSRNPLEAGLCLEMALYDGKRVDAGVAHAQAEVYRMTAELRQLEYDLRQQLL